MAHGFHIKVPLQKPDESQSAVPDYRYGNDGQERDDEVAGPGNHYTAEFWQYDPRLIVRAIADPKPIVGISPYSVFADDPISNKDPLGDIITPWWLKSGANDMIPGYGGGIKSNYKSFISSNDLKNFDRTAISLYTSNDIFKKTVERLQSSRTVYHIQQEYITNAQGINANYNPSNKTISFGFFGISKSELFEETFHAGQDDYYSGMGIKRSGLANEVEAKVANILSDFKDESVKPKRDYSVIKDYFKTGKKGKGFDKALDELINDTYDVYKKAKGEDWSKANNPSTVDKTTVLKYLESTTGVKTDQK